jgi:hypothetical protein
MAVDTVENVDLLDQINVFCVSQVDSFTRKALSKILIDWLITALILTVSFSCHNYFQANLWKVSAKEKITFLCVFSASHGLIDNDSWV